MGDPRRLRKKYHTPSKAFEKERMLEEMRFIGTYGLRNKKEFWRHRSQLSHFRDLTRGYRKLPTNLMDKFLSELRSKLYKMGLVTPTATADDILSLTVDKLLDRRVQTLVHKLGLAKTVYQARQLVVHRHILVNGKVISSPSYICTVEDEKQISYSPNSPFAKDKNKLFIAEEPVEEKSSATKEEPAGKEESNEEAKEEKNQ
jgi:small subunit ribosomal protein S4